MKSIDLGLKKKKKRTASASDMEFKEPSSKYKERNAKENDDYTDI